MPMTSLSRSLCAGLLCTLAACATSPTGRTQFLAFSEQPDEQGNTEKGNAFQRIEAFRDGFLNGLDGELVGEQVCAKYTVEQASDGRS